MLSIQNPLRELLPHLFVSNADLLDFLSNDPVFARTDITHDLPGTEVPHNQYLSAAVALIETRGLATGNLFEAFRARRPQQHERITAAERAYADRPVSSPAPRPGDGKAVLRALLPFEDGDALPGRDTELQLLETMVLSTGFRFGALWGLTGSGKTSLLRAGLLPRLRRRGFRVAYLERPDELCRQLREMPSYPQGDDGKFLLVAIDQFEELFLREPDRDAHAELAEGIARCLCDNAGRMRLLVGIRADFFGKLHYLRSTQLPDPTAPQYCFELQELTRDTAAAVLRDTVATRESRFDEALIEHIVDDLCKNGRVRAVELQIVATFLKNAHATRRSDFDQRGGADGVMRDYIEGELQASPDPSTALLVLRELSDLDRETKAPRAASADELLRLLPRTTADAAELLQRVLDRLGQGRLLTRDIGQRYRLTHDYLVRLVRQATEHKETRRDRARRQLHEHAAGYERDRRFRIPSRDLYWALRLSIAGDAPTPIRPLLIASLLVPVRRFLLSFIALAVMLLVSACGVLWTFEYLSIEPAAEDQSSSIVVRSGHPALAALPYFGRVVVDTGYSVADLANDGAVEIVAQQTLTDNRWNRSAAYDDWALELAPYLAFGRSSSMPRLLGEPERAFDLTEFLLRTPTKLPSSVLGPAVATATPQKLAALTDRLRSNCKDRGMVSPDQMNCWAISGQWQQGQVISTRLADELGRAFDTHLKFIRAPRPPSFSGDPGDVGKGVRWLITAAPDAIDASRVNALLDLIEPGTTPTANLALAQVTAIARSSPNADANLVPRLMQSLARATAKGDELDQRAEVAIPLYHRRRLGWQLLFALEAVAEAIPHPFDAASLEPLLAEPQTRGGIAAYAWLASRARIAPSAELGAFLVGCSRSDTDKRADACSLAVALLDYSKLSNTEETRFAMDRALGSDSSEIALLASHHALTHPESYPAQASASARLPLLTKNVSEARQALFHVNTGDAYERLYREMRVLPTQLDAEDVAGILDAASRIEDRHVSRWLPLLMARWHPRSLYPQHAAASGSAEPDATPGGNAVSDLARRYAMNGTRSATRADNQPFDIALARAHWEERNTAGKPLSVEDAVALLRERSSATARLRGVCVAYLVWLEDAKARATIEARLRELAGRHEPELRMAANQALEMIWVGKLVLVDTQGRRSLGRARVDLFSEHGDFLLEAAALLALEHWIGTQAVPATTPGGSSDA